MANQITNYKCPACTGPLHFSAASGKLECEYCGSAYDAAEIEALYAAQNQNIQQQEASKAEAAAAAPAEGEEAPTVADGTRVDSDSQWQIKGEEGAWGAEAQQMRTYSCPSCGAELICDANTAATSCPYCNNTTIIPGQLGGATLKPDYVIPFRMDKKQAMAALREHYKGKKLLPKSFTSGNHVEEIKGVYVPFWLFDGEAEGEANFHTTRSFMHMEGDYQVTTTQHFRVYRSGKMSFSRIPVDASSKMPDDYMDSIEPFDYNELQPFNAAYLSGYLADKYDVSVEDCSSRADDRAGQSLIDSLADTVTGYESCINTGADVKLHRGKVHYALMPVWMLNSKWQGKDFLFAMNGQTGKLVGDLPVSTGRFFAWFGGVAVAVAAIAAALLYFL